MSNKLKAFGNLTFFKNYSRMPVGEVSASVLKADYSVGSGAATYAASRGSSNPATYIDNSGRIQLVTTSNVARVTSGFYNSTGFVSRPGLIMEVASTNLVLYSKDFSQANWGYVSASAAVSSNTAPDGGTAYTITTTDNSLQRVSQQISVSASTVYTFSWWAKKGTQSTVKYNIYDASNAADIVAATAYTIPASGWARFSVTFTTPVGCVLIRVRPIEASGATGTTDLWGAQLEALPFASTFIPTTTAALTRNAETLTYPISGNRTAASESIFIKFTPYFTGNLGGGRWLTGTDTKDRRITTGDGLVTFLPNRTDDGTGNSVTYTNTSAFTSQIVSGICKHSSPYREIYKNGVSQQSSVVDWTTPSWGTNFQVGCASAGNAQADSIIQSLAIFADSKSASDVASISNLMAGGS